MDPALVTAIFAGLTGVIGACAAGLSSRQKSVTRDVDALDDQVQAIQRQLEAALRHIWELRQELSANGLPVPPVPDELSRRRNEKCAG